MRIVFACGASYEYVKEQPYFAHTRADGRGRLAVYDSDGGLQQPQLAGEDAYAPERIEAVERRGASSAARCMEVG
jgi:hypothetical protein